MGQCCLRQAIGCARNLLEALCRDSSEEEAREADRIRSGPTKRRLGQSVSAALSPSRNARSAFLPKTTLRAQAQSADHRTALLLGAADRRRVFGAKGATLLHFTFLNHPACVDSLLQSQF